MRGTGSVPPKPAGAEGVSDEMTFLTAPTPARKGEHELCSRISQHPLTPRLTISDGSLPRLNPPQDTYSLSWRQLV